MKKETMRWVKKAEDDLRMAHAGAKVRPPINDGICFHCQQAAEKYIKGFLVEAGVDFPRTHDLVKLLILALPVDPTLRTIGRGLKFLKAFAVDVRYTDADATARQSKAALRWAVRIRAEIRKRLGLPNSRNRKRA
jgi:HEPN domain-containing protein